MEYRDEDPVTLISFGSGEWPRFMIYHRSRDLWWGHRAWKQKQRDGEMWSEFHEAENELHIAIAYAEQYEDESDV